MKIDVIENRTVVVTKQDQNIEITFEFLNESFFENALNLARGFLDSDCYMDNDICFITVRHLDEKANTN